MPYELEVEDPWRTEPLPPVSLKPPSPSPPPPSPPPEPASPSPLPAPEQPSTDLAREGVATRRMSEGGREAGVRRDEGAGLLLATMLVDFHHNLGPIIEFSYPPSFLTAQDTPFTRLLPFLALPDGAHLTEEDYSYFHLPDPREGERGTVFGISCNRQLPASELLEKGKDVTRSTVQKALVILAKKPIFGPIRDKLGIITRAFFSQRNFTETDLLVQFHQSLDMSLRGHGDDSALYMGTSLRELVYKFRHKTLILLKLLLLQKRILFFGYRPSSLTSPHTPSYPVERLCTFQYSLVSLVPHLLPALENAASPHLPLPPEEGKEGREGEGRNKRGRGRASSFVKTSDRESLLRYAGMPLDLFGKDAFFQPYMPLQQIDLMKEARSFVAGTTNAIFTQQREGRLDVVVNIESATLDFPPNPSSTPNLEKLVSLTSYDRKWMDELVGAVCESWDEEDPRAQGGMRFKGSDDYLRAKFEDYICSALSAIKYTDYLRIVGGKRNDGATSGMNLDKSPTTAFGEAWIAALRKAPAIADWDKRTDSALFDLIEPRHPCLLTPTPLSDIGIRLSEGLHDLHLDEQLSAAREWGGRAWAEGSKRASGVDGDKIRAAVGGWGAYLAGRFGGKEEKDGKIGEVRVGEGDGGWHNERWKREKK